MGPVEKGWGVELPAPPRVDGRRDNFQLRPTRCELSILSEALGSARFQHGLTSAIAGIRAPVETAKSGAAEFGMIQVLCRPMTSTTSMNEKYFESAIAAVASATIDLKHLARTVTTVVLQPEADDGCLISCLCNAAVCAILDAGLPCKSAVMSVSIAQKYGILKNQVFDPTAEELQGCEMCISYAVDSQSGALVQAIPETATSMRLRRINTTSEVPPSTAALDDDPIGAARACCRVLTEIVRQALQIRMTKMVTVTITANNLLELPDN